MPDPEQATVDVVVREMSGSNAEWRRAVAHAISRFANMRERPSEDQVHAIYELSKGQPLPDFAGQVARERASNSSRYRQVMEQVEQRLPNAPTSRHPE